MFIRNQTMSDEEAAREKRKNLNKIIQIDSKNTTASECGEVFSCWVFSVNIRRIYYIEGSTAE